MKTEPTFPGKTYAVTSPNGCTVTQRVGAATIVNDVPAGVQTLLIAQAGRFEISDDAAVVTECGGSAELVFTAATTRAASSGTGCDCGFTAEECDKLKLYASAEGRNIPISEDGEIITQIGHTYTITAGEMPVKCTDADFNPLCEVAAHKQIGFVAPATAAYVDNVTCTVTEVFRAAAPVELSGNGGGEPEGDYVTLDENGCITSGRLDTLVDGSYLQYNRPALTSWDIGLPALSNGANMFFNCRLDKTSALVVLSSLPAYESGVHVLTIGMHKSYEGDADILAAIDAAQANGWTIRAQYQEENTLPADFTQVECLQGTGAQYIRTGLQGNVDMGIEVEYKQTEYPNNSAPICGFGANGGAKPDYITIPYFLKGNILAWNFGAGTQETRISMQDISPRNISSCNILSDRKIKLNAEVLADCESLSGSITNVSFVPLFIYGNQSLPYSSAAKAYLYKARFSEAYSLTRDYIPALDETGAPCLYDLVEQKAYYNAGSGDFLYPAEATTYSLRRVLPDWGKLTENGLRRLYHAPADWDGELYDYAIEHGFKPIIEPERPEEGYWTPQWRETEDEIVLDWIETEVPEMEVTA